MAEHCISPAWKWSEEREVGVIVGPLLPVTTALMSPAGRCRLFVPTLSTPSFTSHEKCNDNTVKAVILVRRGTVLDCCMPLYEKRSRRVAVRTLGSPPRCNAVAMARRGYQRKTERTRHKHNIGRAQRGMTLTASRSEQCATEPTPTTRNDVQCSRRAR